MNTYTVTELNDLIRQTIDDEFRNKLFTVSGEISNCKNGGNHTYLTLKEDTNTISVAFWNEHLDNKNGEHVEIIGKISYYTKSGYMNIIGKSINIIGVGNLHNEYEQLRKKYEKKGYFNNKKPLPNTVKNIGIVTSEGGAALQDFIYVLKKNKFSGKIFIYDCNVQGIKCAQTVAAGINYFNNCDSDSDSDSDSDTNNDKNDDKDDKIDVDIIVVTRGGGSFEDLMGFSHPHVIEAIYNSKKYIVSAVGHEVDNMLSDYVANYRAPTPSIAGEVISSINNNKLQKINDIKNKILNTKHDILQSLYRYKKNINQINNSIEDPINIIDTKINDIYTKAKHHVQNKLMMYANKIKNAKEILESNDINKLLNCGFVIMTDKNNNIITSIDKILNKNVYMIHSSGTYEIKTKHKNKET
jgi:exodeoxyribonuclease VII large subunit